MSYTRIKTYLIRPNGSKSYMKDVQNDNAFGLLKESVFSQTSDKDNEKSFMQYSYENEVSTYVQRLLNGITAVTDENGEIAQYIFEDKENFDEKHLLWACFDMLIKADMTIKQIKQNRIEMLEKLIKAQPPFMTSPIGDLPIDSGGMGKAIDEIISLRRKNNEKCNN